MAESPNYELEAALIQRFKANTEITVYCGTRVFDRPPDNFDTFPYISFGPSYESADDAECIDGEEVTMQVDIWSRGGGQAFGSAEVKKIAKLVKAIVHNAEIDLGVNALANIQHRITRYLRESDGATNHAAVSIVANIEIK